MKIEIWTDGSCIGMKFDGELRTMSEGLGPGTNNRAEILAVIHALRHLPCPLEEADVTLYTDSALIWGWLAQGWKVKANRELVGEMKVLAASCRSFNVQKVQGHAGVEYNELADELAQQGARSNQG